MYVITTIIKTIDTATNETEAIELAKTLFNSYNYVEVKEIISFAPYYSRSVVIYRR